MMERDLDVKKAVMKLMRENKKEDLAIMIKNEERVANMWRESTQQRDEQIHQLQEDYLKLQEDMEKLHAAHDLKEIVHAEIVENLKKEKERLGESAKISSKQAFEYMRYWEKAKKDIEELERHSNNLKIEKDAIKETLINHRDSYIKTFDQLEKYHTGVLLHTDGTAVGTTFMVDGQIPHMIATARIKVNIKTGVQASYETMEDEKAERVWIHGEMSPTNIEYQKRKQTHKEWREDRVRAMILESAAYNNRKAPKMPKKLPEVNKWECSHCWAVNSIGESVFKKDRLKCDSCFQWTKADEVGANV